MDESDRVKQARDRLFAAIDQWYRMTCHAGVTSFGVDKHLTETYKDWLDASKPPGDPHKEWVDAEKMKPPDISTVLVKLPGHGTQIGRYNPHTNGWSVQPYGGATYLSKVTHWRYIPEMED